MTGSAAMERGAIEPSRWAWASIDVAAVEHNVRTLIGLVTPAELWAVVKADGYGHGAVRVAQAALRGGAAALCVALTEEGVALRDAGIEGRILVLSEQPLDQAARIIDYELTPTVSTLAAAERFAQHAPGPIRIHVNVDTGMQRVGVRPGDAVEFFEEISRSYPQLLVEGIYTHFACADDLLHPATDTQLASFDAVLGDLASAGHRPSLVHCANSAAGLAHPAARRSMVRAGIAIYGISPGPGVDHLTSGLQPALSLHARVSHVKRVAAGSSVSYGWRHRFESDTTVATVPCGYADGVPRRLGTLPDRPGADVLIGGRRYPIVGVVTMDQFMVDVGRSPEPVTVGDEVVLLGQQGDEHVRAEEWADRLGTIGYEIVCGISKRVERIEQR